MREKGRQRSVTQQRTGWRAGPGRRCVAPSTELPQRRCRAGRAVLCVPCCACRAVRAVLCTPCCAHRVALKCGAMASYTAVTCAASSAASAASPPPAPPPTPPPSPPRAAPPPPLPSPPRAVPRIPGSSAGRPALPPAGSWAATALRAAASKAWAVPAAPATAWPRAWPWRSAGAAPASRPLAQAAWTSSALMLRSRPSPLPSSWPSPLPLAACGARSCEMRVGGRPACRRRRGRSTPQKLDAQPWLCNPGGQQREVCKHRDRRVALVGAGVAPRRGAFAPPGCRRIRERRSRTGSPGPERRRT
jgi:hypothetical protein